MNNTETIAVKDAPLATDISQLTLASWQQFVDDDGRATAFHHRKWIELLAQQYGYRPLIVGVHQGGRVRSAIPFLEVPRPWRGNRLVSLPFTDCLAPLVHPAEDWNLLIEHLHAQYAERFQQIALRSDQEVPGVNASCHWVRHVVDLPGSAEELPRLYAEAVRRNLRKACRSSLEFETSTERWAVDAFYQLHARTRQRKGIPVQPLSFFHRLGQDVLEQGLGYVAVVRQNNTKEIVAAAVLLSYNGTITYKYAASNPEMLGYRPNEFLIHNVLENAVGAGCREFDFGVSRTNQEGLKRFKAKWGAAETPVFDCSIVGDTPSPVDQSLPLRLAATVIRHSPLIVCRGLGELLYRFAH